MIIIISNINYVSYVNGPQCSVPWIRSGLGHVKRMITPEDPYLIMLGWLNFLIFLRSHILALHVGKKHTFSINRLIDLAKNVILLSMITQNLENTQWFPIPIRSNSSHLTPWWPLATMEKPIVAPTMQCVPEMGSFKKEAVSCQTADPATDKKKHMTSMSQQHAKIPPRGKGL